MRIAINLSVACACVASLPINSARAQDALGEGNRLGSGMQLNSFLNSRRNADGSFNPMATGNALDANTQVGGHGFNTSSAGDTFVDFGARNAIVTGNVAAGRGFRGSVGYTAEWDFRAPTGTNDLFRFTADSAYSSPQFVRLGMSFDQLRFGQDMALIEIPRATVGASPDRLTVPSFRPTEVRSARARIDRENMISSASIGVDEMIQPRVVGTSFDRDGHPLVLNASAMRGLTAEPPQFTPNLAGLTLFDVARVREDVSQGRPPTAIGKPFESSFLTLSEDTSRVTPELAVQPLSPDQPSDYDALLDRIAQRFARIEDVDIETDPDSKKRLDDEYQELRRQLTGQTPSAAEIEKKRREQLQPPVTNQPDGQEAPPDDGDLLPPREKEEDKPLPRVISPDQFAEALRHGGRIEQLSPEDQTRFDEIMTRAQQRLEEGQFFLAERLFDRALRFTPGHPLATVGVAHSQIGSGLYMSAASTLRTLLARQPELIDVTYGPSVLPARNRLRENISKLQERLSGTKDLDSYAFVLAYLGHQLGDRALVQQGLDVLEREEPEDELVPLLRSIWLAPEDESSTQPGSNWIVPGK